MSGVLLNCDDAVLRTDLDERVQVCGRGGKDTTGAAEGVTGGEQACEFRLVANVWKRRVKESSCETPTTMAGTVRQSARLASSPPKRPSENTHYFGPLPFDFRQILRGREMKAPLPLFRRTPETRDGEATYHSQAAEQEKCC